MFSTICQYEYPIQVHVPRVKVPDNGFPVLFVLDGQKYSELFFSILDAQHRHAEKTNVTPMIIVSIAHEENSAYERRVFDFTTHADVDSFPSGHLGRLASFQNGGAQNFQRFLKEEMLPTIEANYPVNRDAFYLYGHSLGGLFLLFSYLKEPFLFAKYVVVSPSLWWNKHELLKQMQQQPIAAPPLAIYVGGDEADMADDALTLYNARRDLCDQTSFYIAMNENHASIVPTTASRALRFFTKK